MKPFPIKGWIETSLVDWVGKICSVIFLPYCNFRCVYCHNYPLVLSPESLETISFFKILSVLRNYNGWIDGVCVSGGEPTLHNFLPELFYQIKKEGFKTKLDTNGTSPKMLSLLIKERLVDFISMDIKAPLDRKKYSTIVGSPVNLSTIRKSIDILREGDVDYEFRLTVVPCFHSKEDIYQIASQLNGAKRLTLQNFNPTNTLSPYLQKVKPYPKEDLLFMQNEVDKILGLKKETVPQIA